MKRLHVFRNACYISLSSAAAPWLSLKILVGTLTNNETSVCDSLDIVQHFPRSLLQSVSNLLARPDKTSLPRDVVSDVFENPLPRNSSVMKCLKQCGLESSEGARVASGSVTNPLQVSNGRKSHATLWPDHQ